MATEAELFKIASDLGLTAECAREMVAEHIARRKPAPRYVRTALSAARADDGRTFKIGCKRTQGYLDRRFSFNEINVHEIDGFTINRHRLTNEWIVA